MSELGTVLLVAVGRLGRSVIEAAKRLGIGLPGHALLAPGEPVPDGVKAPGGTIVVMDAAVDGGDLWGSVAVASGGRPAIVVAVGGEGMPQRSDLVWIALRREPGVDEAAALLVAGLHAGRLLVPDSAIARFTRVDLRPGRPREACAMRLAARCAGRLLADLPASADPALHLVTASPAWAILHGGDVAPDVGGTDHPALSDAMADPVAPVAAAFAAGRLRVRDVVAAAREAVAGLADQETVVPLTVLAGDLDRAITAIVAAAGLSAGRALLTTMLSAAVARDGLRDGARSPDPAGPGPITGGDDLIEDVLADLDRRARSIALAITFTKRTALLSGLRDLADAARHNAARQAVLPDTEPIVALLESRWSRLDAVEDMLAGLADSAVESQTQPIQDEDYLASLPDGEEAAIDALLREPGLGPALLSGDLQAFLTSRAATRFFAWVPEQVASSSLASVTAATDGSAGNAVVAAISGVPGALPAGQALDLAKKLVGGGAGSVEPAAVPIDSDGMALIVEVLAGKPGLGLGPGQKNPSRACSKAAGTEAGATRSRVGPASVPASEGWLEMDADDGFWSGFRGLIARARPIYDDPGLAIEAARGEAPMLQLDALWLERHDTLRAEEDGWLSCVHRAGPGRTDEPGANLDAAFEYAHLWEDGLQFWESQRLAAAETEAPGPSLRLRSLHAACRPLDDDLPAWCGAAAADPLDPPADTAELAAIGLATHLITHIEGYLAYTYAEENGLIHTAILAPADDPAGTIAGLLANSEALPLLRRDARSRLADPRFHDAIRAFAHDLGAEVATRDWLRMPVSPHQRLLAERGLALMHVLPGFPGGGSGEGSAEAIQAPAPDVPWDAGMVLPGLSGRPGNASLASESRHQGRPCSAAGGAV